MCFPYDFIISALELEEFGVLLLNVQVAWPTV